MEALQELLSNIPEDLSHSAFIIAQHLSPSYKSRLRDLLSRVTSREVREISDGEELQANTIYITPPDNDALVRQGVLHLHKPVNTIGPKPSVNILFHSLAVDVPERAVGIVLSGTGQDGGIGLREIRDAGGYCMAQDPGTARYDGMPHAAIQLGKADLILSPEQMGKELASLLSLDDSKLSPQELNDEQFKQVINRLSRHSGVDFRGYKDTTIRRRIIKRILALKKTDVGEYLDYIKENPAELQNLFQMLLIGVTQFFRDPETFQVLSKHLKDAFLQMSGGDSFRLWVPGCSSGEEPYSLAILINEILEELDLTMKVQIFATDIDESAIETARKGVFPAESLVNVPEEYREKYFSKTHDGVQISKHIRQNILFSRHDLVENPPFLRLNMISCRNLLIYFSQKTQRQLMPILHYSLLPKGILFLGKSETIGQFNDLFTVLDSKHRVFQRVFDTVIPSSLYRSHSGFGKSSPGAGGGDEPVDLKSNIQETLYADLGHPFVVVNGKMELIQLSGNLETYIGLQEGMFSNQFMNMLRPELKAELQHLMTQAIRNHVKAETPFKRFFPEEVDHFLRIRIRPLVYSAQMKSYYLIEFERLNIQGGVQGLTQHGSGGNSDNERINELELELSTNRQNLQNYIEELETSNEELQSLNEELQSTNEELQSTNEELETSNEELQASNEELQVAYAEIKSINVQMAEKDRELELANARMETALYGGKLAWWEWRKDTGEVNFSDAKVTMLGYDPDSFPRTLEAFLELVHPEDSEANLQSMRHHLEGKIPAYDSEYRIRTKDGNYVWYWDRGRIVEYDDEGAASRLVGLVINVNDRKQAELSLERQIRERDMLVKEIHHRVKNNFNMVTGLIELQLNRVADSSQRSMLRDIQSRIRSMALIHRELYEHEDLTSIELEFYLPRLADAVLRFADTGSSNILFYEDVEKTTVPINSAISLGLMTVELITNSLKYAFKEGMPSPTIRIAVKHLDDGKLRYSYRDNGSGYPDDILESTYSGIGMDLVKSLASQLRGEFRQYNDGGSVAEVDFQLPGDEPG